MWFIRISRSVASADQRRKQAGREIPGQPSGLEAVLESVTAGLGRIEQGQTLVPESGQFSRRVLHMPRRGGLEDRQETTQGIAGRGGRRRSMTVILGKGQGRRQEAKAVLEALGQRPAWPRSTPHALPSVMGTG
jgi:hypothetical protein